jgi:nucleotide-binding universal stress UspA family protein
MLSQTKKILCATDGSRSAERAVAYAVDMASKLGADLSFATVNAISALELAEEPMFWDSTLGDAADEQLHKPLQVAATAAGKANIANVKCVILHGRDIAGNIVKFGSDHGYDHVVVGSQGRTGVSRILLGSVAEAIVRHAHCPVTVVR